MAKIIKFPTDIFELPPGPIYVTMSREFVDPQVAYDKTKFMILEIGATGTGTDAAGKQSIEVIEPSKAYYDLLDSMQEDDVDRLAFAEGFTMHRGMFGSDKARIEAYLQAQIDKCLPGQPFGCIRTEQTYIFFGAL